MPLGTVAPQARGLPVKTLWAARRNSPAQWGTQSVKVFDQVVAHTGLNEKEARNAGFEPVTADTGVWDHKVYYPPAHKSNIRVTADKETRKLWERR